MKIEINIPKEFEHDYESDRFEDCFQRILADVSNHSMLCGRYERETIQMFMQAFKESSSRKEK